MYPTNKRPESPENEDPYKIILNLHFKEIARLARQRKSMGRSSERTSEFPDHEPQPMRGGHPAKKVDNSADRFNKHNQDHYENRYRDSRKRIAEVERHNEAYPKLNDEIRKRRSLEKPIAINQAKVNRNRSSRSNTRKNKNEKKQRRNPKSPKKNKVKSKITKRKSKKAYNRKARVHGGKSNGRPIRLNSQINGNNDNNGREDAEMSANNSSGYPDTSRPSLLSLHSDFSLDHEPMLD